MGILNSLFLHRRSSQTVEEQIFRSLPSCAWLFLVAFANRQSVNLASNVETAAMQIPGIPGNFIQAFWTKCSEFRGTSFGRFRIKVRRIQRPGLGEGPGDAGNPKGGR